MEAYVINLKSSKDRWQRIQKSFEGTGIHLNRVDPVKATKIKGICKKHIGTQSLFLTVLKLVKDAKRKELPNILVLEDDCVPAADFSEKWLKVKSWLDIHTDKWDMYSGGSLSIKDPILIEKVGDIRLYEPKSSWSSHFIYIQSGAYDTVIRKYSNDFKRTAIVATDGINSTMKLIVSHPFVAYQKDGKSTITRKISSVLSEMKTVERKLGKTRKIRRMK